MTSHHYMQRCIDLAKNGAGSVSPNPMVGAILVYNDRIVGEGWHKRYGEAHAEVNCIAAVKEEDGNLIEQSTLYVSLEPCAHFGKTSPCADLIIKHKIPKVVIGCRDPFEEVNGKGIEKLKAAGVEVVSGILENECKELNKRFFTFYEKKRPYVILKWAQTADGKVASLNPSVGGTLEPFNQRLFITNDYTNRLVHRWRSEESAILIGTNTALLDNPELTTRLYEGNSPVRLVLDMNLRLPSHLKVFDRKVKTIVLNGLKQEENENLIYAKIDKAENIVSEILKVLYQQKIQSVIVEGGAGLLQSFIDEGLWDEARVISNEELIINDGLNAPEINMALKISEEKLLADKVEYYKNPKFI